jgi:hypothetical protein
MIGASELALFERSGHRPWAEQPAMYFDALTAFLDR